MTRTPKKNLTTCSICCTKHEVPNSTPLQILTKGTLNLEKIWLWMKYYNIDKGIKTLNSQHHISMYVLHTVRRIYMYLHGMSIDVVYYVKEIIIVKRLPGD